MTTTLKELRKAYARACKDHRDQFTHDGSEFVTGYAKYLIQYLENEHTPEDKPIEFTPTQ